MWGFAEFFANVMLNVVGSLYIKYSMNICITLIQ